MVDTAFSYGRSLIVWKFLQGSFKVKESDWHEIRNADTAFLLRDAEHLVVMRINALRNQDIREHVTCYLRFLDVA